MSSDRIGKDVVDISVVIPVYMGSQTISELYERLVNVLEKLVPRNSIQLVLVDDHSSDNTWETILNIAERDHRVVAIKLSRNFGQHAALTAGLHHAEGNWTIVMDCDLQDIPEEIPKLFKFTQDGYQVVVGVKKTRKDPRFKVLTSNLFSLTYRKLTDTKLNSNIGNFGVYSKKVIQSILKMPEQNRSFGLLALWVGYSRKEVVIDHAPRLSGQSNYSFQKRFRLAMDSLISYSNKVLNLTVYTGLIISSVAFVSAVVTFARYILYGNPASGWTSTILLVLFSLGMNLTALGVMALYIGKIYDEVKNRPLYLIERVYSGTKNDTEI